ncbi:hypothetical protein PF002_g31815, partial [Phytophthora fragariae]
MAGSDTIDVVEQAVTLF